MYRNLYDTDCTTWSPEGRVYQTEYACESVKQGSCGVGLKSNTHVVVCGLRRAVGSLATHNEKVVKVDDYIGVTFSGITADAKTIIDSMRNQALSHRITFEENPPVTKIVTNIQNRAQKLTQTSSKRPFGVGMLVAGVSPELGKTYLYELSPSGNIYEYKCTAFGCRSQSSNTYLELHMDSLRSCTSSELLQHAVNALQRSLPAEQALTVDNCHVAIIGLDAPWKILNSDECKNYLDSMPVRGPPGAEENLTQPPEDIEE
eukprot:GHVH01003283.1.p1 GENE.GHVH01003283.1~~GHVH01003283.1.p1  ORF type:complete len:260 (+),score=21.75 GHVH01003283.1:50-829(+)